MKASPLVGLGVIACIFGGLYFTMKGIMIDADQLFEEVEAEKAAEAASSENGSDDHGDHDDTSLPTQLTMYFSSIPESVTVKQGERIIAERKDLNTQVYSDAVATNIQGHSAEFLVEVNWKTPSEQNFVELELAPQNHAQKNVYLRSDDNIQDVVVVEW